MTSQSKTLSSGLATRSSSLGCDVIRARGTIIHVKKMETEKNERDSEPIVEIFSGIVRYLKSMALLKVELLTASIL